MTRSHLRSARRAAARDRVLLRSSAPEDARRWLESLFVVDGVYVRVRDIEAHFTRAGSAGAVILGQIVANDAVGQLQYRAEDIEGHRWMFVEPL